MWAKGSGKGNSKKIGKKVIWLNMKAETKHGSDYVGYYEYRHPKVTYIDMNVSKTSVVP